MYNVPKNVGVNQLWISEEFLKMCKNMGLLDCCQTEIVVISENLYLCGTILYVYIYWISSTELIKMSDSTEVLNS